MGVVMAARETGRREFQVRTSPVRSSPSPPVCAPRLAPRRRRSGLRAQRLLTAKRWLLLLKWERRPRRALRSCSATARCAAATRRARGRGAATRAQQGAALSPLSFSGAAEKPPPPPAQERHREALLDADAALQLDRDYSKAVVRRLAAVAAISAETRQKEVALRDAVAASLRSMGVAVPEGAQEELTQQWGRSVCVKCYAAGRDAEGCRSGRGHRDPDFEGVLWKVGGHVTLTRKGDTEAISGRISAYDWLSGMHSVTQDPDPVPPSRSGGANPGPGGTGPSSPQRLAATALGGKSRVTHHLRLRIFASHMAYKEPAGDAAGVGASSDTGGGKIVAPQAVLGQ